MVDDISIEETELILDHLSVRLEGGWSQRLGGSCLR